jgi:hypothetical protein
VISKFSLHELVKEVLGLFKQEFREKKISFFYRIKAISKEEFLITTD